MEVASFVVVGAPALAEASGAAISRGFSQKKPSSCAVLGSQGQCLRLYRGESSSSSSQHPRRFHLSKVAAKAVHSTSMRTKTRIRARLEGLESADLEVDLNVQPKRPLRPVVERFNIHHEKNVSEERLKVLGVSRWSKWDCGPGVTTFWEWKADELVYISKGSVEVVPDGCYDTAIFYAGDLVRFPKWFQASMTFDEDYEQCYKFLAYGD